MRIMVNKATLKGLALFLFFTASQAFSANLAKFFKDVVPTIPPRTLQRVLDVAENTPVNNLKGQLDQILKNNDAWKRNFNNLTTDGKNQVVLNYAKALKNSLPYASRMFEDINTIGDIENYINNVVSKTDRMYSQSLIGKLEKNYNVKPISMLEVSDDDAIHFAEFVLKRIMDDFEAFMGMRTWNTNSKKSLIETYRNRVTRYLDPEGKYFRGAARQSDEVSESLEDLFKHCKR